MVEMKARDWLSSDYLERLARRVACTHRLRHQEVPDLHQDLCLALLKVGLDQVVNYTWVFHTANHRAVELLKRECKNRQAAETVRKNMAVASVANLELTFLVHARASRLPEPLRRFYRLRFEEGHTQREIVQEKQVTRGSVRGLERRCLRWMVGGRREDFPSGFGNS